MGYQPGSVLDASLLKYLLIPSRNLWKKNRMIFLIMLCLVTCQTRKKLGLNTYRARNYWVNSYVATRIMLLKFWNALNYLRLTLNTPWCWPFRVIKVKCNHTIGLRIYDFLLRFTSNFNLQHIKPSKYQWPWLWPYKVTQIEMSWFCWTLHMWLMSNSNTWPNSAPLQDISLWNRRDLDSDLSSSRKL